MNGDRGQFGLVVKDVAYSKNVVGRSLLVFVVQNLVVPNEKNNMLAIPQENFYRPPKKNLLGIDLHASFIQTNLGGLSISPDGKNDCIEDIFKLCAIRVLGENLDGPGVAFLHSLQAGRDAFSDEVDSVLFHVLANFFSNLLVKASKKDGTNLGEINESII